MIRGNAKEGRPGKWNGLGGKLELGESMLECAVREFHEEAHCKTKPEQWTWLGELYFPNFKAHKNEDWWVTVLVTELTDAQASTLPLKDASLKEGFLLFVPTSGVLGLDLWDGDRYFLPFVFKKAPFQGTFYYQNGICIRHEVAPIKFKSQ